jgi:hypothetical protein
VHDLVCIEALTANLAYIPRDSPDTFIDQARRLPNVNL